MLRRIQEIIEYKLVDNILYEYSTTIRFLTGPEEEIISIWRRGYLVLRLENNYKITAFKDIDNTVLSIKEKVEILNIIMDSINQYEKELLDKKYYWKLKKDTILGNYYRGDTVFNLFKDSHWLFSDKWQPPEYKTQFTEKEFDTICFRFDIDETLFEKEEIQ